MDTNHLITELKQLEEHCARQVASVHGYLTKAEVERLEALRQAVGKSWDAVNARWQPLEAL